MNIDYREELLNYIKNHSIKKLPSQNLINNDREIAEAIWTNLVGSENKVYNLKEWYNSFKWRDILKEYSSDISFWKKVLDFEHYDVEILLLKEFKSDFPIIVDYFLNSNEELKRIYTLSNNDKYFKLLNLNIEEKIEFNKELMLKKGISYYYVSYFKEYQDDLEFVKNILQKTPYNYCYLNEENKKNIDFIKLALKDRDNFFLIPDEYNNLYFSSWYKYYKNSIQNKELNKFNEDQKLVILKNNPNLLKYTLIKEFDKYKDLGLMMIHTDKNEAIELFDLEILMKFTKLEHNIFDDVCLEFIKEYTSLTKMTSTQKKYIELIKLNPEMENNLNNNLFYLIQNQKRTVDLELVNNIFELLENKYKNNTITYEKAEIILQSVKSRLPSEILKEKKFPKADLFKYFQTMKMMSNLETELPIHKKNSTKKI